MEKKRRRKFGDRKEGYLVRTASPMNKVMPYIMKKRSDACNTFSDSISCSNIEKYCREKVKAGYANFGVLHVLIAAYVRMLSQYPGVNRFVNGRRIYHRHEIEVNMVVKRNLTVHGEDTAIKVCFDPASTALDVYNVFNDAVRKSVPQGEETSFDKTAKIMSLIPRFVMNFAFSFLSFLDYFGLIPSKLLKVSPFHGSMIITSMGSLGIRPIYHHLYDFGNLPAFISYGVKRDELYMNREGQIKKKKVIDIKVVTDERICDGFYYAAAFKEWRRILEHPEQLDNPPEEIIEDID